MTNRNIGRVCAFLALASVFLSSCGSTSADGNGDGVHAQQIPATNMEYVVLAWNDLGMHCLNPTYDNAVLLPPYNTIWAQVIKRGNPPEIVTTGLTVEYSILSNTYSYGKRSYGQFWDNCLHLFGITLANDTGLNLEDPGIHNGLSGTMVVKGNHFQVNGIPLTPVLDDLSWDPYQVAQITVKNSGTGAVLVETQAMAPTSDEIDCAKCHGSNPLLDVLQKHDDEQGTSLVADKPILCAGCHGSPALATSGAGSSGMYLSQAMHGFHADKGASCYDCHPGALTQCSRSLAHTNTTGNCASCHGTMSEVAGSVASGARIPWVNEPKCVTCHPGVAEVDTGTALYRNATAHNSLSCPACHQSPHAMIPSREATDNYQARQYQTKEYPIGDCKVCHGSSRGEGIDEFQQAHGGTRATACAVCHTGAPGTNTAQWPHQFQWKSR